MDTSEILKRVRQIEIKTRGLSNNIFAGEYHSAFKGRGKFLNLDENVDENMRARFGFYFLALECITNITDTSAPKS